MLFGALLALAGCGRGPPDSTAPEYRTAQDRVAWMAGRIRGRPPSDMIDAHFLEQEMSSRGGHMGPGRSMHWFFARIQIDPRDAPAWAARTQPVGAPFGWQRDTNPLSHPTAAWAMAPEEFDGAAWYDPVPLVGAGQRGYQAGYMVITQDGKYVFVWQHWR